MIRIELPDRPVFRGEILKGRIQILSESSYTAREVKITLLRKERYLHPSNFGVSFSTDVVKDIVFNATKMKITPPKEQINFEVTIPEDAPYTFESKLIENQWLIQASIKSRLIQEKVLQNFVVLPYVLESEYPPSVDKALISSYKKNLKSMQRYRPFHIWRYTGLFHRDRHLNMILDKDKYFLGDTISGTIFFSDEFVDADLKIYLVFLNKSKNHRNTTEEEQLIMCVHNTFHAESSYKFSFSIPDARLPTLETNNAKIWWIVRVVIIRRFCFTKVLEQEIEIKPLIV